MKRAILLCLMLCAAFVVKSQDIPYSKYINFSKEEFKENRFKYDDYTNTWSLRKKNGLHTTLNVLAIFADAMEEIRPAKNDYSILVQMGKNSEASSVKVIFYNNETYHKLLSFIKGNGSDITETSSGNLVKYMTNCNGYEIELDMERHIISRTSARTADRKTVKNVDESYNEYQFTITTGVEPWSEYLEKQAVKQKKRDAKGKKKKSVDELM